MPRTLSLMQVLTAHFPLAVLTTELNSNSEQKIKQRTINIHTAGQTGVNQFPQTNCVAFPFFPSPKKDLRHDQGGDRRLETGQRACSQECHLIPRRGSLRGACSLSHSQSVSHMAIRCEGAVTLESFYGGVTQRGDIHATSEGEICTEE